MAKPTKTTKSTKTTAKKSPAKKAPAKKAAANKAPAKKTAAAANNKAATTPQGVSANMPMFYNDVVPLTSKAHGDLKVKERVDNISFAKVANSIMLTAVEFPQAAQFYPVVFGVEAMDSLPFAVTGHTGGVNSFIDEDGNWRDGAYIPAYVRRYPFILMENPQNKSFTLAVDPTSDLLSKKEGKPLFDKGEGTDIAKNILNLCAAYQKEFLKTKEVCKQINESGLLIERAADVTLSDGKTTRVSGFRIVDEKAFNALDDKKFIELRKTGALTLIYCHLWSMRTWDNLLG